MFRIWHEYQAQSQDELNVSVGDYMMASAVNVNDGDQEGWILGTSLTTGESGYFPASHAIRVPESDCWTLHTRVPFIGPQDTQLQEPLTDLSKRGANTSLEDCARSAIDSKRKIILWDSSIGKLLKPPRMGQKLMIMRHSERIDYTFPKWTDQCFTELDGYKRLDLNLPLALPERKDGFFRYPWKFDPPLTNMGM